MHILFIAPRLPLPADTGGKIRTYNILKQLASAAKVHLVCFSFDKHDREQCISLKNLGIEVTLVPIRELSFVKKVTGVLVSPQPVSIKKYYTEQMEHILIELNETNQFDAVHIDHLHMAHYRECFGDTFCLMDEHNVEYNILKRCANVEKSLIKRMVYRNQAGKMERFEQMSIQKVNAYTAVSQDDKMMLDQMKNNGQSGHVIPNGVDTQFFDMQKSVSGRQEEAVVFTGSMDWLPNDDAAMFFCKDILPLIWEMNPNVKIYIVGKGPSAALEAVAKNESRIVITGRVDDVRTYAAKSKIFVVPLRIGGGTRLKILEAMSMRMAVVSTSIGAEGINYTDDQNIVIADKPKDFADKITTLLKNEPARLSLGQAGRDLVLNQYDWDIIGKKLVNIYEQIKQ